MELNKLDPVDKNVAVWVSKNMPSFLYHVLVMNKNDYEAKRGIKLDVKLMLNELIRMNK